jgi:hypothetical protein
MNAGFCMVILETELANSSVQPGFIYTAKYNIVKTQREGSIIYLVEFVVYLFLGSQ